MSCPRATVRLYISSTCLMSHVLLSWLQKKSNSTDHTTRVERALASTRETAFCLDQRIYQQPHVSNQVKPYIDYH